MISLKKILQEYKIGDNFIITDKPSEWTSFLNSNSPILNNIIYPYHGKIVDMKLYEDHIAMTDGVYGWALCTLVRENLIINQQEIRKEKLKKLNEISVYHK